MTNMSEDMAETSVTDFFTLPKLGRVHPCLVSTMPQKWTAWKLTHMGRIYEWESRKQLPMAFAVHMFHKK